MGIKVNDSFEKYKIYGAYHWPLLVVILENMTFLHTRDMQQCWIIFHDKAAKDKSEMTSCKNEERND